MFRLLLYPGAYKRLMHTIRPAPSKKQIWSERTTNLPVTLNIVWICYPIECTKVPVLEKVTTTLAGIYLVCFSRFKKCYNILIIFIDYISIVALSNSTCLPIFQQWSTWLLQWKKAKSSSESQKSGKGDNFKRVYRIYGWGSRNIFY